MADKVAIRMPRIPRVSTKARNIARSFGYASIDVFRQYNPTIVSLHQETRKIAEDVKRSMNRISNGSASKQTKEFTRDNKDRPFRELINDFKSGKWYDKDNSQDDYDLDTGTLDEDWGDETRPTSNNQDTGTFSSKAVIHSMNNMSANISNNLGMTNIRSAQYIVSANAQGQRAVYDMTARGFNQVSSILLSLNGKLDVMAENTRIQAIQYQNQTQFYSNASQFFQDTTKSLNNISATLERIAGNTDVLGSTPGGKKNKNRRDINSLLFGGDFSFTSYMDMVKENVKETTELAKSLGGLVGDLAGANGKKLSPLSLALKYSIEAALPDMFKKAMTSFNDSINAAIISGLGNLSKGAKKKGGLAGILGEIFLPQFMEGNVNQVKYNKSNYNKGPVAWDGIARKSVVEVIPTYLAKIYAQLGGEEKYFDYEKGQFISLGDIKNKMTQMQKEHARRAGGQFRRDALSATTDEQIRAEIERYFDAAFKYGKRFNDVKTRSKSANWLKSMGLTKQSAAVLNRVIDDYEKTGDTSELMKFMAAVSIEREGYKDRVHKEELSGHSSLSNLNNGLGRKFNDTSVLTNIYQIVGNIYALLATGISGRKKKGNVNSMMFDIRSGKIVNKATYVANQQKEEAAAAAGEQEKENTARKLSNEIDKAGENFLNNITSSLEEHESLNKAGNKIKKFLGKAKSIIDSPFEAMGNVLNTFNRGIYEMFWGNDNKNVKGLISTITEKVSSVFDDLKKKFFENEKVKEIKDKFGEKIKELFHVDDWMNAIKEQFGIIGNSFRQKGKRLLFGNPQNTNYTANAPDVATMAQEQNAKAIKAKQAEIATSYEMGMHGGNSGLLKGYSGGASNYTDDNGGLVGIIKQAFSKGKSGTMDFLSALSDKPKKSKEKIEKNITTAMEEVSGAKGAIGVGAITGAGLSLLGTVFLGPIAAAGVGAGVGLIAKSEKIQNMLFGMKPGEKEKDYEKSMRSKLKKFFSDQLGDVGFGAAVGAGIGTFAGAPLVGAVVGGALGYVKSNEKLQKELFGDVDELGAHTKPLGKLLDKIKGNLPRALAGAGIGGLIGLATPLGLVGSMAFGAGVGLLSTSEGFREYMFGKDDDKKSKENSFTGIIKNKIIFNLDELHHNSLNALQGITKIITGKVRRLFGSLWKKLSPIGDFLNNAMQKTVGFSFKTIGEIAKVPFKFIGKGLEKANKGVQRFNLNQNLNVYDKNLGRNLTAEERNQRRAQLGLSQNKFDALLAGTTNAGLLDLENNLDVLSGVKGDVEEANKGLINGVMNSLSYEKSLDEGDRKKIAKLMSSGNIKGAKAFLEKKDISGDRLSEIYDSLDSISANNNETEKAKGIAQKLREDYHININDPEQLSILKDRLREEKENEKRGLKNETDMQEAIDKQNQEDFQSSELGYLQAISYAMNYLVGFKNDEGILKGKWTTMKVKTSINELFKDADKDGKLVTKEDIDNAIVKGLDKYIGADAKSREEAKATQEVMKNKIADQASKKTVLGLDALAGGEDIFIDEGEVSGGASGLKPKSLSNIIADAIKKSKDGAKDVTYDMFGGVHQHTYNNQGEPIEAVNDKETQASNKRINKFTDAIGHIPIIGGVLSKISGMFGLLKDGLFGNKDENKKGFFDNLMDLLTNKNGIFGKIANALSGLPGIAAGIAGIASGIAGISIASGKFDGLLSTVLDGFGGEHRNIESSEEGHSQIFIDGPDGKQYEVASDNQKDPKLYMDEEGKAYYLCITDQSRIYPYDGIIKDANGKIIFGGEEEEDIPALSKNQYAMANGKNFTKNNKDKYKNKSAKFTYKQTLPASARVMGRHVSNFLVGGPSYIGTTSRGVGTLLSKSKNPIFKGAGEKILNVTDSIITKRKDFQSNVLKDFGNRIYNSKLGQKGANLLKGTNLGDDLARRSIIRDGEIIAKKYYGNKADDAIRLIASGNVKNIKGIPEEDVAKLYKAFAPRGADDIFINEGALTSNKNALLNSADDIFINEGALVNNKNTFKELSENVNNGLNGLKKRLLNKADDIGKEAVESTTKSTTKSATKAATNTAVDKGLVKASEAALDKSIDQFEKSNNIKILTEKARDLFSKINSKYAKSIGGEILSQSDEVIEEMAEGAAKISAEAIEESAGKAAKTGGKASVKSGIETVPIVGWAITIISALWAFQEGYNSAARVFKVKEANIVEKVINGYTDAWLELLFGVLSAIGLVDGFTTNAAAVGLQIGSSLLKPKILNLFIDIFTNRGLLKDLKTRRDQSQAEYQNYVESVTSSNPDAKTLNYDEWNAQTYDNYTWTERAWNGIKGMTADFRAKTKAGLLYNPQDPNSYSKGKWKQTRNEAALAKGTWSQSRDEAAIAKGKWNPGPNTSGGGSGFVNQYDSGAGEKGCGPAVASMAASALGKNLSVSSAISKSSGYRNSAGVDAGYFGDVFGSAGINTSYMTGPDRNAQIMNSLSSGKKVVLLGQRGGASNALGKMYSPFGPNNHYVLATGYDRNGLIINDPELRGPVHYPWDILNNVKMGIAAGASGATEADKAGMANHSYASASPTGPGAVPEEMRKPQYENLGQWSPLTAEQINSFIESRHPSNPDFLGKGDVFVEAAEKSGLDPRYILAHAAVESGWGGSPMARNAHNYFGIGAFDSNPTNGYNYGNDGLKSGIVNGAVWIRKHYYDKGQTNVHNMRYNNGTHQYCTSDTWVGSIGDIMGGMPTNTKVSYDKNINASPVDSSINPSTSNTVGGNDVSSAASSNGTTSSYGSSGSTSTNPYSGLFSGGLLGLVSSIGNVFRQALSGGFHNNTSGGMIEDPKEASILEGKDSQENQMSMSASSTSGAIGDGSPAQGDTANNFPYFNQGEAPQGSYPYPNSGNPNATIKSSGCGPTSMAMVLKSYGVNTDPTQTAQYSLDNGFRASEGTGWGFFNSIGAKNNLITKQFSDQNEAANALENNIPVIGSMKPGDFTKKGHFIVFTGKDGDNVVVNDPASRERTGKIWNAASALGQAKQFWAITDAEGKGSLGKSKVAHSDGYGQYGISDKSIYEQSKKNHANMQYGGSPNGNKLSGGDSGLFNTSNVLASNGNTQPLPTITIPDTKNGIDPALVNKLIESFSNLLGSIAQNTSPIQNIYQLLASGNLNKGAGQATAPVVVNNQQTNNNSGSEVSAEIERLTGVLAAIAKG